MRPINGRIPFPSEEIELEPLRVLEGEGVTHLCCRVASGS